jgi:hypothetical protein
LGTSVSLPDNPESERFQKGDHQPDPGKKSTIAIMIAMKKYSGKIEERF